MERNALSTEFSKALSFFLERMKAFTGLRVQAIAGHRPSAEAFMSCPVKAHRPAGGNRRKRPDAGLAGARFKGPLSEARWLLIAGEERGEQDRDQSQGGPMGGQRSKCPLSKETGGKRPIFWGGT